MNRWIAQTAAADINRGGRVFIQEALYSPQISRPAYAVGDEFVISGQVVYGGAITAVNKPDFDVELKNGTRLRLSPTPAGLGPPHIQSSIPFDDRIARPI